ncbi:hypothetical protein [Thermococcus sp.]|uniref:hypothetical protein n=1 Tax=Thermococcus sp. TaxID=35749 RepID=UPI0026179972|nr:hypothetical protein [Thermococcus sp.]
MPCIHPPDKVENINEESFMRKDGGSLKVRIENEGETLETTMTGSLKSVEEIAEMLGVEAENGSIKAVVDGVKVRMERGRLELEFENGERMKIEKT